MNTPLQDIAAIGGTLTLTLDDLGNQAWVAIRNALKLNGDLELTNSSFPVPATANLFVAEGTLAALLGQGDATVRLYLFETATVFSTTERHAVLLFSTIPTGFTVTDLLAPFGGAAGSGLPIEAAALQTLSFDAGNPYLLLTTLPYEHSYFVNPPFPPAQDTQLSSGLLSFINEVKKELAQGYLFLATAQLATSLTIPLPPSAPPDAEEINIDLSTVLTALGLDNLCSASFGINGTLCFSGSSTLLQLLHELPSNVLPANIPLSPELSAVGISIQLGSGAEQIPSFILDGSLTLDATPSSVDLLFNPYTEELQATFADLPDIADLAQKFDSGSSLNDILGNSLPEGVLDALGTLQILSLQLTIDTYGLTVGALSFSIVTEHALPLFDGITIRPALVANFTYPFASYYNAAIDVVGKWSCNSASLDTILLVQRGSLPADDSTTLIARLGLGSGVNLSDIAAALFHKQIAGLPALVLSDVDIVAQRTGSGTSASESVNISLDVAAGWTLDGVDIGLDDLSLSIEFTKADSTANWSLQEASAAGRLEIGSLLFNLSAEYDGVDRTWTFSGGTIPAESVKLGDLLTDITQALSLEAPTDFLSPFSSVNVNGCFLEYQSGSAGSAAWQIVVSLDFSSGNQFNGVILDDLVIRFGRNGTGTSYSFDATTPTPASQGVDTLTTYLNQTLGLSVVLPSALTDSGILLQGLSAAYNAATANYNFTAYLNFGHDALVQLGVDITTQTLNGTSTKTYDLGGSLLFNPGGPNEFVFKLELVKSGAASDLVASFQSDTGSTGLTLDLLVKAIDPSASGLDAFEIEINNALFAHSGANGAVPAKSLFAVDMGAQVNLSQLGDLPLVGQALTSAASLDLAFQVSYATGAYTANELQAINQLLNNPSFQFPESALAAESISLSTAMRVGGQEVIDMTVPVTADSSGNLSGTGGSSIGSSNPKASSTGGAQSITWFPLDKTFGTVLINRVGLAFDSATTSMTAFLDGALTVGPVTFDLLGLEVNIPLTGTDKFKPTFDLQGLGLDYDKPPVNIGGALFKADAGGATEFDGFVTIATESLEIGAVGSFARMNDGEDSLFVYAVLGEPLGGPAFFFVTGLAAGFGYNRKLLPPAITEVQSFPLVAQAMSPSPQPPTGSDLSGVRDYVAQQLQLLQANIIPAAGENFLAAGLKFTSFELVNGFLLAVVQFGNEFQIDFLGLANATLPPDDNNDPIAEAQLALLAHYVPAEGAFLVQGQLTPNSYVLSRDCHLTGGFALACWNSGEHAGVFVLTIGGYAAGFQLPDYYPQVPQVGFNWQVNGQLNVKGGGYFALVPHALMAGGKLDAVWQSGDIKAWFLMAADFLIEWKPIHYQAQIHVELGAQLTIHFFGTHHVSIDASAELDVWGPPFGGHAQINIDVIGIHFHFNINFGSSSTPPPNLTWSEFQTSFLPAEPQQWLGVNIQGGLLRTVKGTLPDSSEVDVWIVRRDKLAINTSSVFPVKTVEFSLDGAPAGTPSITPTTPGIAPMDVNSIDTSTHTITITKVVSGAPSPPPAGITVENEQLKLTTNNRNIPSALWGHSRSRPLNPAPGEDVLESVVGCALTPTKEAYDDPDAITVARNTLAYETTQETGFAWVAAMGTFQAAAMPTWADIENSIQTTQSLRTNALDAMGFSQFRENFNQPIDLDTPEMPQVGTMGS